MERILIANQSEADMYKYSMNSGFTLLQSFNNPLGDLYNSEMREDKPGMNRARQRGSAPHSMANEFDESDQACQQFAKTLSDVVIDKMQKDESLSFKIIAEPSLLGKMRSELQKHSGVDERIQWVEKNIMNVPQNKWSSIIGLPRPRTVNHFVNPDL